MQCLFRALSLARVFSLSFAVASQRKMRKPSSTALSREALRQGQYNSPGVSEIILARGSLHFLFWPCWGANQKMVTTWC